ncbi:MAG: tetratricopeptide repeat protein [Deltaproteobacteria bacterium]|jgi:predicted Zn-dependent protease|nr:tetratricopeptide repeat protein [Deltaproteobacteria bacterium]
MERLLEIIQNPQSPDRPHLISTLLDIGLFGAHSGFVVPARELFQSLLNSWPHLSTAKIGLALARLVVNEFEEAENSLKAILAEEPDNFGAIALLGLLAKMTGRTQEAELYLNQASQGPEPYGQLAKVALNS